MKTACFLLLPFVFAAPAELETDYARARTFRVEIDTSFEMETTDFSMEIDGEPVDTPGNRSGSSSEDVRRVVYTDNVLEHEDGLATRVERSFELVEGQFSFDAGEYSREGDHECPLSGVTLEISGRGEDTEVEVTDGPTPDRDEILAGHRVDLPFDALLPADDVEVGDSWELDGELVRRVMGFDLQRALFPRPEERQESRGPGGGGGSEARLLATAEWEGTAELLELEADCEEGPCARIRIEASSSGDLPESPRREGFRRRRSFSASASPGLAGNVFEIELEGELHFSLGESRPLSLEVDGRIRTDRTMARTRNGQEMLISITREGTYAFLATVTTEDSGE